MWGISTKYGGFLRHLVTSFQVASYIDRCRGIFDIFPFEAIRNLSTKQDYRGTGCTCVSTSIYFAIYLKYSDIPEFILKEIFKESKQNKFS